MSILTGQPVSKLPQLTNPIKDKIQSNKHQNTLFMTSDIGSPDIHYQPFFLLKCEKSGKTYSKTTKKCQKVFNDCMIIYKG